MPKKTPEPEQAPKADNYAKINMPAAFLTPHDIQTSDGRTFEKCFVSFPKGTKVNGIDVSGFSTDVFLSPNMTGLPSAQSICPFAIRFSRLHLRL